MPTAEPLPVPVPDAAPGAAITPQAPPETASSAPPSPASDPSLVPGTPPAPSTEAAAAPVQEPAIAASPDQATTPVPGPNPPEPAAPDAPAPAVTPPAPNENRLASTPSITIVAPHAAPSTAEPVPTPLREEPEEQSPAQPNGAPGLVLVARAGDTMPDLYAKVYRGVRPPPYAEVVAANRLPLRAGAIVVFPMPQGGWPDH